MVKLKPIHDLLQSLVLVLAVCIAVVYAQRSRLAWDLTADQRYTLAPATRHLLSQLEEPLEVELFLTGDDLPSEFQRFRRQVDQTLEDFDRHAQHGLRLVYTDPNAAGSGAERQRMYQYLSEQGIPPTNLFTGTQGNRSEKIIFPGLMLRYRGQQRPLVLIQGQATGDSDQSLNESLQDLEYLLSEAIDQMAFPSRQTVVLPPQARADTAAMGDFVSLLQEGYRLQRRPLRPDLLQEPPAAVVVAQPGGALSDIEKFTLDQYLLQGGSVLMLLDALHVNMDSIGAEGSLAFSKQLDLTDLLFRYGLRLEEALLQDATSGAHPIVTGQVGTRPQVQLLPWPYYPIITRFGQHPATRNLDAVQLRFANPVDTVAAPPGLRRQPLLLTSERSRQLNAPVALNLNSLRQDLNPELMTEGPLAAGWLTEGTFTSLYKNRLLPAALKDLPYTDQATAPGKLVVIGDGDVARQILDPRSGNYAPLGSDPYTGQMFANKRLLENLLAYLVKGEERLLVRNKQLQIRPLDPLKVANERSSVVWLNVVVPLVSLVLVGLAIFFFRKKRYSRHE